MSFVIRWYPFWRAARLHWRLNFFHTDTSRGNSLHISLLPPNSRHATASKISMLMLSSSSCAHSSKSFENVSPVRCQFCLYFLLCQAGKKPAISNSSDNPTGRGAALSRTAEICSLERVQRGQKETKSTLSLLLWGTWPREAQIFLPLRDWLCDAIVIPPCLKPKVIP